MASVLCNPQGISYVLKIEHLLFVRYSNEALGM